MPKKKTYTKAQKAAYAKRMAAKKKKPSTVVKQNQFRTEFKDKVSIIKSFTIGAAQAGSVGDGPANSSIIIPDTVAGHFTQGTANGQVDGNSINLRYLTMKINLDYSDLLQSYDAALTPGAAVIPVYQKYSLVVRQCWVKKDIKEFLIETVVNPNSNRDQPAFTSSGIASVAPYDIARAYSYNADLDPEFLNFSRKRDTGIKVLKTMRIYGDQRQPFRINSTEDSVAPDKHLTFSWNMPKQKQTLSPSKAAPNEMTLSSSWIPFVIISLDRKYPVLYDAKGDVINQGTLKIKAVDHLTYTDN